MSPSLINIYNNLWNRLIDTTYLTDDTLNSFRKLFILTSLFFLIPNYLWIGNIPDALYNPPRLSFAVFFSGFPDYTIILLIHILLIITLMLIGINRLIKLSGIIYFLLIVLLLGFIYSLGKISHGFILFPITILCFSLNNWSSSLKKSKTLPIPSESLLAIIIAFGMFTAGFQKCFSWIDFNIDYSGFLHWFYPGYYNWGKNYLMASSVFSIPRHIIELFDYLVVIFELSPFIILLSGKRILWKLWLLIACLFHISNIVLLNIPFLLHAMVYLPFIFPMFLTDLFSRISNKIYNPIIIAIGFFQILLLFSKEHTIYSYFISRYETTLYVSLFFFITIFIFGLFSLIDSIRTRQPTPYDL